MNNTIVCSVFVVFIFMTLFVPDLSAAQNNTKVVQYVSQAFILKKQGQILEAAAMFEKAIEAETKRPQPSMKALGKLYRLAAKCYKSIGKNDRAVEHYKKILGIERKSGDDAKIIRELNNIGTTLNISGQYKKAIEYYQEALEMDRKQNNESNVAISLNNIGLIYKTMCKYDTALKYCQQALEISRKLNNESEIAICLNNIGVVYKSWSQYDKAFKYFQQAIETSRKFDGKEQIAVYLNNIGMVYKSWGKYGKAIEYYKQSLEINHKLDKQDDIALNLNNIGNVYKSWGQYDKALEHFQKAIKIDRELGRQVNIAIDLGNIGTVYKAWGQYDKALEYYQQALEIDRKLGKEDCITTDLNNIGGIYHSWGLNDKAIEFYSEALDINLKLGRDDGMAINLNNLGVISSSMGRHDKAMEYYQQALKISTKLGEEDGMATSIGNIGGVYHALGNHEEAIRYYNQALGIDRKLGKEDSIATDLNNIGALYYFLGQYKKAIKYLHDSIKMKEKLRRTASGDLKRDYLASQIYTYQHLSSAYLKGNDPQGVLESIEQSRAKLLAERIAGIDSALSIPTLDEVQKTLNKDETVLIYSNISSDNFILMAITSSDISVKEINKESYLAKAKSLYKNTILLMLENQRGSDLRLYKKKDAQIVKTEGTISQFNKTINYYRMALIQSASKGKRGIKHANNFAHILYDLLIKPVENELAGKSKLTILSDGILGFIPFETLIDKNNQYLAEKYDIRYTQSMTISNLLKSRKYKQDRKPLLAFGGAVYDEINYNIEATENSAQLVSLTKQVSDLSKRNYSVRNSYAKLGVAQWGNLPGTLSEVKNISAIVLESEIMTGKNATENNVKEFSRKGKLSNYKVIHFATHGLVVPALPELSAIVLSQFKEKKEGEDGYLRMNEISKLDIQADFINLSACETGLGKIYGGEGIVGLTQSFLIAGANGLSVSLWQVSDDSTSKFMAEMYKKVQKNNTMYNQAIAEVKRDFIKGDYGEKWKSPFYWAPFVYYGH